MRKFILTLLLTSMMFGGYFSDNFLKFELFRYLTLHVLQ